MAIIRRVPARYAALLMPLLLSIIMTCVISGVSTLLALGPSQEALRRWPEAWGFSWLVAFPTLLVVLPIVRRLVALLVAPPAR